MDNENTVPAGLDHLTTMPALLTGPASLGAVFQPERVHPLYTLIFAVALVVLVALVFFV